MSLLSRAVVSVRYGARLLAPSRPLWASGNSEWRPPAVPRPAPSFSALHTSPALSQHRAKGEMRIAVIGQSLFGQEVSVSAWYPVQYGTSHMGNSPCIMLVVLRVQ